MKLGAENCQGCCRAAVIGLVLAMLQKHWIDLHIHTVLSPCAQVEMIPPLIVRRALELRLSWIGITDHNSAGNVQAVLAAAEGTGLAVTPGLEVQSREEVCAFQLMWTVPPTACWLTWVLSHRGWTSWSSKSREGRGLPHSAGRTPSWRDTL